MEPLKSNDALNHLAKRYVWWEQPDWALTHPAVFLANVMDIGIWEDMQLLRKTVNDDLLRQVLLEAPPGYFHARSWDYWHLKLGFTEIPPLPKRNI